LKWQACLPSRQFTGDECGSSRGLTDCVALNTCDSETRSHLQNVSEKDLILASAGFVELSEEQVKKMTVYLAHRFNYVLIYPGKVPATPNTCQYPRHQRR